MLSDILNNIQWFSQGALKIRTQDSVIYTDPYMIDQSYHDADIILLTHPHGDHLSYNDIEKVLKNDTVFIVPISMSETLDRYPNHSIAEVVLFDILQLDMMTLEVVPAYNIVKTQFHSKDNDWVGYVLTIGDVVLYYTSDTEFIPEMNDIETDIIFVPLGQIYTMDSVEDAVKAVLATKAKIAVPIHYGLAEGNKEDVEKFKQLLSGKAEVVCL